MKQTVRYSSLALLTVFVLVLSACGPTAAVPVVNAPAASGGASKAESAPVEFTGTIEAISGNQWTVNGQPMVVDTQALGGVAFSAGDTVRIKGTVAQDGTVTVSRVEAPQALAAPGLAPASITASGNASVSGGTNGNTSDNSNTNNSTDDNGNEQKVTGVVEAINIEQNQITIDGVIYSVAPGVDLSTIAVGDTVQVEFVTNADGTLTATQVGQEDGADDDDDSNGDDSDDDEDSDDDDSDDDNSNDEDDSDDDNSNDDNSGGDSGSDD